MKVLHGLHSVTSDRDFSLETIGTTQPVTELLLSCEIRSRHLDTPQAVTDIMVCLGRY
jgi:hypothetical protein